MPVIRPLTELQLEALGASINGTLVTSIKSIGKGRYLAFYLSDGREVTRRVVALRKRGFMKWEGPAKMVPTPEGIHHWKQNNAKP